MKCLYLHGLDSKPLKEKDEVLAFYFQDYLSPELNYRRQNIFEKICQLIETNHIEILVGSSFGGLMAFHLAQKYGLSAILFNPALAYIINLRGLIPTFQRQTAKDVFIFIGKQDDVVSPQSTIDYLRENEIKANSLTIEIVDGLEHKIPVNAFSHCIKTALEKFED